MKSASVVPTAFTFQGQLEVDDSLANGLYDFHVHLFNASSSGTEVKPEEDLNDVQASNGLVNMEIDFGYDAFSGGARWLELDVSPAGANTFQTISPRTEVTPAPLALGLPNVYSDPNLQFVGIGSTNRASGATALQVNSSSTDSYGGMYVATSGASAKPFYGYSLNGSTQDAWHQFDGASGEWQLVTAPNYVNIGAKNGWTRFSGDVKGYLSTNGLVKAGASVYCDNNASTIYHSFNNVEDAAAVAISDGASLGKCTLDFGFVLTDRYWTVTVPIATDVRLASCEIGAATDQLDCFRSNTSGVGVSGGLIVMIY